MKLDKNGKHSEYTWRILAQCVKIGDNSSVKYCIKTENSERGDIFRKDFNNDPNKAFDAFSTSNSSNFDITWSGDSLDDDNESIASLSLNNFQPKTINQDYVRVISRNADSDEETTYALYINDVSNIIFTEAFNLLLSKIIECEKNEKYEKYENISESIALNTLDDLNFSIKYACNTLTEIGFIAALIVNKWSTNDDIKFLCESFYHDIYFSERDVKNAESYFYSMIEAL